MGASARARMLAVVGFVAFAMPEAAGDTVIVSSIAFSAENLRVDTPGASTAGFVTFGQLGVGPAGGTGYVYSRPIIPFARANFAGLAGQPLASAWLSYTVTHDLVEAGESFISEVRLFTTDETDLTEDNRNLFAAATGDGGANTTIGSVTLEDDMVGVQTLAISGAGLAALYDAINSSAAILGIAFREFQSDEPLDEFFFGIPPAAMTLEVTTVPEPATILLVAAGLILLPCRRPHTYRPQPRLDARNA